MKSTLAVGVLKYTLVALLVFTLFIVYELSSDGIMIAGEYRTYYLGDFFEFIKDIF